MTRSGKLIVWSLFVSLLAIGRSRIIRTEDYELVISKSGKLKSVSTLRDSNELDLSELGIREIRDYAFQNVSVKILNLQSNNISELYRRVFSGLDERLEELNLASNNIKKIHSPFVDLLNLKSLNLSDNPVKILGRRAFAGVPKSADIFVKNNRLRMFESRLFDIPVYKKRSVDNEEPFAIISWSDKVAGYMRTDVPITIENSVLLKVAFAEKGEYKEHEDDEDDEDDEDHEDHEDHEDDEDESLNDAEFKGGYEPTLKIHNHDFQSVAKNWFQLPSKRVKFVSLSDNDLRNISKELLNDLPGGLTTVELDRNSIKEIKNNVISNDHIKMISLEYNLIEIIENRAFESLRNLQKLYLRNNKIKELSFAASLSTRLSTLDISVNQISEIPDGIFSKLKNVTVLDLENNDISVIKSKAFQGMNSLRILRLSSNKISEIESGALLGISTENRELKRLPVFSLKILSLNDNLISDINEETFQGLGKLVELELEGNLLIEIPLGIMKDFRSLKKLGISRNSIVKLQNGVFYGLRSPCNVEIHRNTIEIIQGGIFDAV